MTSVGSIDPSQALAWRWRAGALEPISAIHRISPDELLHIDRQKQTLLRNTRQFVAGAPANHALLTGARGTGKSTLVKAMLQAFGDAGLRMVEVAPHDLVDLPDIVRPLRAVDARFVLFVDDFSVALNDPALSALKAALDGDLEAPPDNVLIYATSNRRHLMPEMRSDNDGHRIVDGELHPSEATEEKVALSERFGLWLSFPPFGQDQYLDMVRHHLARLGVHKMGDDARAAALRWAQTRGSRSGRIAAQFARDWAGQLALSRGSRPPV